MIRALIISAAIILSSVSCTQSKEDLIKQAVLDRMIDPGSTKFGKITVLEDKACFTVNSKNRLGGYTGDSQAFVQVVEEGWHYIMSKNDISHNLCLEILEQI